MSQAEYDKAKPGMAWADVEGEWLWAPPTPNGPNSAGLDLASLDSDEPEGGDQLGASATQDDPLEKRTVSYANSSDSSPEESSDESTEYLFDEPDKSVINNSILAGVGALALGYMVYEYRNEIRNYIKQFRGYVKNRRENRKAA